MKTYLKFTLMALLFLFCSNSFAATPKTAFDQALDTFEKTIENYAKEDYYEKLEYVNKKTKTPKKFSEFSSMEKDLFILLHGISLNHALKQLSKAWDNELEQPESLVPEDANADDIRQYIEKLNSLRRTNALKVEKLATKFFNNYSDEFTKEEQEFLLKNIKEFNSKIPKEKK